MANLQNKFIINNRPSETRQIQTQPSPTHIYGNLCLFESGKAAVLRMLARPCQAAWRQEESGELCNLTTPTASYKVFLYSHDRIREMCSRTADTFPKISHIKSCWLTDFLKLRVDTSIFHIINCGLGVPFKPWTSATRSSRTMPYSTDHLTVTNFLPLPFPAKKQLTAQRPTFHVWTNEIIVLTEKSTFIVSHYGMKIGV
jgi:hypothetical protein